MKRLVLFCVSALLLVSVVVADEIQKKHEQMLYPVVRVTVKSSGGSGTRRPRLLSKSWRLTNVYPSSRFYNRVGRDLWCGRNPNRCLQHGVWWFVEVV